MGDSESVALLIDSTAFKIKQLQKAFAELERHNSVSLNIKWKELEDHFHGLERSLKQRLFELENQEKEYERSVVEAQEMLGKEEAIIAEKEVTSLEILQQRRDSTLAEIFGRSEILNPKTPVACTKDGTTTATLEAHSDCKVVMSKLEDATEVGHDNVDAKTRTELLTLCKDMDIDGLHRFISENRKNLTLIREEIPNALRSAPNPFNLVLESLRNFYSGGNIVLDGKKDGCLLGMRRTCLMLMEFLGQLSTQVGNNFPSDNTALTSAVKEQAKSIALDWKVNLHNIDMDVNNGNSLEAHAFLQLLTTFNIASEFDQDELCKLIPAVSRRRQTPELCRLLGLTPKIPDVIEVLANSGRQIDAVNLSYTFGLTDQFPPVPLLKAYLREVRRVSQAKPAQMSPVAQDELNERELSALKSVIKCIEERKLEEQYPVDPIQRRVLQLEKAKADKKRAAEAAKPQSKRARANGSIYSHRVICSPEKSFYRPASERNPYPYDGQYVYPTEIRHPALITPASYLSPHATYYGHGHGYQVQYQVPYIP